MGSEKEYYDKLYHQQNRVNNPYNVNSSLYAFLEEKVFNYVKSSSSQWKILETGCGIGSVLERSTEHFNLLGLDYIKKAIDMANSRQLGERFQFLEGDVAKMNWQKEFDLIIDSHCLHCLIKKEDRKKYFKGVKKALAPQGIFTFESMVAHNEMNFSDYFLYLEDERTLLKQIGKDVVPVRKILPAKEIEKELLNEGFKIIYFTVVMGKKVIPDSKRETSVKEDPDLLRVICANS